MNTQLTQKKRLTIKAQKTGPGEGDAARGQSVEAVVATATGSVDTAYHKPAAMMAILASLVVAALIVIQWMEWEYYKAPPTVWPPSILAQGMPAPRMQAPVPEPSMTEYESEPDAESEPESGNEP